MNREHGRELVMNERAAGGATCVAAAFSARFRHPVAVLSRLSQETGRPHSSGTRRVAPLDRLVGWCHGVVSQLACPPCGPCVHRRRRRRKVRP